MRVSKDKKEQIRAEILVAAGKGFRQSGYDGLGVDALAQKAGVTSGAFYGHFTSKEVAFQATIAQGLKDYAAAIRQSAGENPTGWEKDFLDYYLSVTHKNNTEGVCVIPALTADVARADTGTKEIYEAGLRLVESEFIAGHHRHAKIWPLLALLSGTITMARAVASEEQAREILESSRPWAETMLKNM